MLKPYIALLTAASLATAALIQRGPSASVPVPCPDGVVLSSEMIGPVNMTTRACGGAPPASSPALRKRQCTEQADCICPPFTIGGQSCVEFTDLAAPLAADCDVIHNTLLVIEGTFGQTFFLSPDSQVSLTSGTCEFRFENLSAGEVEYCWQDAWAVFGSQIEDCLGGAGGPGINGAITSDITEGAPPWSLILLEN